MTRTDSTRRAKMTPIAEILEPIRQRVLRERAEQDERDGCLVIDYLEELEVQRPGA